MTDPTGPSLDEILSRLTMPEQSVPPAHPVVATPHIPTDMRDGMMNQLFMRGHATGDEILQATFGEWPPKGLDIVTQNNRRIGLSDIAGYYAGREIPDYARNVQGASRTAGDVRKIGIAEGYLQGQKDRLYSAVGHEVTHTLQGDHYYRAESLFGEHMATATADMNTTVANMIGEPLRQHITETWMGAARTAEQNNMMTYLSEGSEIQARMTQVMAEGYPRWGRLPQTREELMLAMYDSGVKMPEDVVQNMIKSPTIAEARATFSGKSSVPVLGVNDLNELQENLTPTGKTLLWEDHFPKMYGDLIEMMGDGPGRERMGLGVNERLTLRNSQQVIERQQSIANANWQMDKETGRPVLLAADIADKNKVIQMLENEGLSPTLSQHPQAGEIIQLPREDINRLRILREEVAVKVPVAAPVPAPVSESYIQSRRNFIFEGDWHGGANTEGVAIARLPTTGMPQERIDTMVRALREEGFSPQLRVSNELGPTIRLNGNDVHEFGKLQYNRTNSNPQVAIVEPKNIDSFFLTKETGSTSTASAINEINSTPIEATYGQYQAAVDRNDPTAERMVRPAPIEATYEQYEAAVNRGDPAAERMVRPVPIEATYEQYEAAVNRGDPAAERMVAPSSYQTPDGVRDAQGNLLREKARYNDATKYDSAQQDKTLSVKNAPDMSTEDMRAMFKDADPAMAGMQKSGSTATVTHISKDGILTVGNVGDSPVNIYLRDPKTGEVIHAGMVSTDHAASSPLETARIRGEGGIVYNGRNGGTLALGRAYGDTELTGISTEPDIRQVDLNEYFKKGYEVVVTTESDGALEKTGHPQRQSVIAETLNKPGGEQSLAENLVNHADSMGANDNISSHAIVLKAPPQENIMMGVFDGHGSQGGAASSRLKQSFDQSVQGLQQRQSYELAAQNKLESHTSAEPVTAAKTVSPIEVAAPTVETSSVAAPVVEASLPAATELLENAGGPKVGLAQGLNGTMGAVGFVTGALGAYESYKQGDKIGVVVNGGNALLGGAQAVHSMIPNGGTAAAVENTLGNAGNGLESGAAGAGEGVLEGGGAGMAEGALGKLGVVATVAVTAYQVSKETTTEGKVGRATAGTITAGVGMGVGAVAGALGAGAVGTVLLPVVAAGAVGYELDKIIAEDKRFRAEQNKTFDKVRNDTTYFSHGAADMSGRPHIADYGNLNVFKAQVMHDKGITTVAAYDKMDFSKPENIKMLEDSLHKQMDEQKKIVADNTTKYMPDWMREASSGIRTVETLGVSHALGQTSGVAERDAAQFKLAQLERTEKELNKYKGDLGGFDKAHPDAPHIDAAHSDDQARFADIATLQAHLKQGGLYKGAVDGKWNADTNRSLNKFMGQIQHNGQDTGVYKGKIDHAYGPGTRAVIEAASGKDKSLLNTLDDMQKRGILKDVYKPQPEAARVKTPGETVNVSADIKQIPVESATVSAKLEMPETSVNLQADFKEAAGKPATVAAPTQTAEQKIAPVTSAPVVAVASPLAPPKNPLNAGAQAPADDVVARGGIQSKTDLTDTFTASVASNDPRPPEQRRALDQQLALQAAFVANQTQTQPQQQRLRTP